MSAEPIYITTSIPYPNANPHIGFALELVQADFLARFYRLLGHPVRLVTGLDEHGLKIQEAAAKAGILPAEFVAEKAEKFEKLSQVLGIQYDRFVRTTDATHQAVAQEFWRRSMAKGDIYKKRYRAWYNMKEEEFLGLAEEHPDPAVFEVDLQFISLIDEENYFFALSHYEKEITHLLESGEYRVEPKYRRQEMLNFIRQKGLQDVSISRERAKLSWGVAVPDDPDQVMYVWFDALTNYLTGALDQGTAVLQQPNMGLSTYWPAYLHCVGKDISKFHAVLWPGMLLSAGMPLPKQLLIHGFITSNGQKMSKSLGNVVDPFPLVETWGADAVRWYLLKGISTTDDGDFSPERFRQMYEADLANDYGNLVSRVSNMVRSYMASRVPEPGTAEFPLTPLMVKVIAEYRQALTGEAIDINGALHAVGTVLEACNKLIEQEKPWQLAKQEDQQEALAALLYGLLEVIRQISFLLQPVLPEACQKVKEKLFVASPADLWESWERATAWGGLQGGEQLGEEGFILFPKHTEK